MKRIFSIVDKMSALYIFMTLTPITLIVLNAQAVNEPLTGGVKFSFLACFGGSFLCTLFRLGLQLFKMYQQNNTVKKWLGLLYTGFWTLVIIGRLLLTLIMSGFSLSDDELRFYLIYHFFLVGMIVIQWLGQKLFEEEYALLSNAEITKDERPAVKTSWNALSILSILAGVYVFFMEAVLILSKWTRQLPVGEGLTKLWIALFISFLCVQFRFVVKYLELSKHKSESKGKLFWGYHIVWNVILLVGLVMVWSSFGMNSVYLEKIYDFQILQVIIVVVQSIGRKEL